MILAKAKEAPYKDLYSNLGKNGASKLCKLTKTRKRRSLDVDKIKFVKNEKGVILSEHEDIKKGGRSALTGSLLHSTEGRN